MASTTLSPSPRRPSTTPLTVYFPACASMGSISQPEPQPFFRIVSFQMILVLILSICSLTGGVKLLRSVYGLFYGLSCEPTAVLLFQNKKRQGCKPGSLYRRALMNAPALAIYPGLRSPAASICLPPGKTARQRLPFGLPGVHGISPAGRFTYARSVTAAAVGLPPRLFTLTSVTKG